MATWLDILGFKARQAPPLAPEETPLPQSNNPDIARHLAGVRIAQTRPNDDNFFNIDYPLEPLSADDRWRDMALDSETLSRLEPARLLELLCDISPDISRALWDFLRFCNPGYECKALIKGKPANDKVQAALDAMLDLFKTRHGSFDVPLSRLFIGAFLRGAFTAELILDKTGKRVLDLATPDPASFRFVQYRDDDYGLVWRLGQWQNGVWKALHNYETVRYLPIDPLPGSPYGRALAAPALFTTIFLLGLMHDLRRVIAQQGYPRIDLTVNMEKLEASMPDDLAENPIAQREWLSDIMKEIKRVYAEMQPDDAYVHSDVITVGRPVGAVDSSSLGAISGIIQSLERQTVRALKTMPLLMGITDGVSEANANRQWEMHAAGIKSIQHLAENLLEHLLGIGLRVQGVQAGVQFRFSEIRAAEIFRDAQTEQLRIANASAKRDAGWITQDEASNEITGSDAVAEPKAPLTPATAPDASTAVADPGANRMLSVLDELRASREDLMHALERMVELV